MISNLDTLKEDILWRYIGLRTIANPFTKINEQFIFYEKDLLIMC